LTDGDTQRADRQDGEIRERYDHDTSAKSMTVCGVAAKMVSRIPDDRQADRLSGRLALRQAYRDFRRGRSSLPLHPGLAYRPGGEPYLSAATDLYCSISHSHRFGMAAVASTPVGIDIEKIRPHDPRLLEYVAQEGEVDALGALVENAADLLTLIWTLKEATAKASGRGLGVALRRLRITATGPDTFEVDGWTAVSYRYEDFFVGLAFQQRVNGRPPIRWYQPRRLPVAEVAEDPGRIETVPADSFERQFSR
jgi:phosphopantetheinyl transferase